MKNEQTQAPPNWKEYSMQELAAAFFADLWGTDPSTQEPQRPQEDPQQDGGRGTAWKP